MYCLSLTKIDVSYFDMIAPVVVTGGNVQGTQYESMCGALFCLINTPCIILITIRGQHLARARLGLDSDKIV